MDTVLVTGATGRIGGLVVDALAARDVRPRVLVRDPEKLTRDDVDVFVGDYSDAASMARALSPGASAGRDAVSSAFLVSPAHPDQRALQSGFARVAAAAGKPRIVKLSGLGTAPGSPVDSGRWHAETEAVIVALGLPHTFLRPAFFMQNLAPQIRAALADGAWRTSVPDAAIGMVDTRDLAAVICAALLGEAVGGAPDWNDCALTPSGPETVSQREVAGLVAEYSDREIRVLEMTEAETRAGMQRAGVPAWRLENLMQFNQAFARGEGSEVTDVVERVTAKRPRSVQAFVRETIDALDAGK